MKKRFFQEGIFNNEIKNVELLISDDKTGLLKSQVSDAQRDAKRQLEKCKDAHTIYVGLLDSEKTTEEIK